MESGIPKIVIISNICHRLLVIISDIPCSPSHLLGLDLLPFFPFLPLRKPARPTRDDLTAEGGDAALTTKRRLSLSVVTRPSGSSLGTQTMHRPRQLNCPKVHRVLSFRNYANEMRTSYFRILGGFGKIGSFFVAGNMAEMEPNCRTDGRQVRRRDDMESEQISFVHCRSPSYAPIAISQLPIRPAATLLPPSVQSSHTCVKLCAL